MPIFDFVCGACGEKFELLVMSRGEKPACPRCGGSEVSKRPSVFAHRSSGNDGSKGGGGSKCSGCTAGSCAGCR